MPKAAALIQLAAESKKNLRMGFWVICLCLVCSKECQRLNADRLNSEGERP